MVVDFARYYRNSTQYHFLRVKPRISGPRTRALEIVGGEDDTSNKTSSDINTMVVKVNTF